MPTPLIPTPFRLTFYTDPEGRQPVREWLREGLSAPDRRTVGAALRRILQEQGVAVCDSSFGRQLGHGLFEFRVREGPLLVRIVCHAYGSRLILLLGAYDKGRDPSERREQAEIALARRRLADWQRTPGD